jgi:hypothetical protein
MVGALAQYNIPRIIVYQHAFKRSEKTKYLGGNDEDQLSRNGIIPDWLLGSRFLKRRWELVKGLITRDHVTEEKLSYWQLVFLQSKANGCSYHGEDLPHINWQWPKNTWFQEQLSHHLGDAELAAGRLNS